MQGEFIVVNCQTKLSHESKVGSDEMVLFGAVTCDAQMMFLCRVHGDLGEGQQFIECLAIDRRYGVTNARFDRQGNSSNQHFSRDGTAQLFERRFESCTSTQCESKFVPSESRDDVRVGQL